jgi:hypothetical protein
VAHEVGHLVNQLTAATVRIFETALYCGPPNSCEGTAEERAAGDYYAAIVAAWRPEFVAVKCGSSARSLRTNVSGIVPRRRPPGTSTLPSGPVAEKTARMYVIRAQRLIDGVAKVKPLG